MKYSNDVIIGWVSIIGGALLSFFTYLSAAPGGTYTIFLGLVIYGFWRLIKSSTLAENSSDKKTKESDTTDDIIRAFYALVIVLLGFGVGFFVYTNTVNPDAKYPFKLGLDLAGGSHLVYEADTSNIAPEDVGDLMNVLRDVIERRVNVFGVSEPIVQVEQSSFVSETRVERLVVELPGVSDVAQAIEEIGKTPLLEFKLVDQEVLANEEVQTKLQAVASGTAEDEIDFSTLESQIYKDTGLTGRYLESAQLEFSGQGGHSGGLSNEPVVSIRFNNEGAELFEQITAENVGENLAIFLDGEVISAPRINEAISGGSAIISGGFDPEEAKNLAQNLNFGALPVPIELQSTQTIGASLGAEVLEKGTKAGAIGLGFIIMFMLLWYRLPGLVATIALMIYVVIMLGLFKLIPVTLTAAGLAGFVLSMGMAVDANVLVFERMKEEYRNGKGSREAAKEGFSRAWSAIRDGNITSLLSAIILFWFGTSLVKGFALVFGIGVIMSMVSALTVTRTLLLTLPRAKKEDGSILSKLYGNGIK
ncbi:protein translocase subunit SecD [Candidatus Pacebacteria bacterium]|nr:protein translocase subunit SecD [Candidatus Paceibacterota bacterium]